MEKIKQVIDMHVVHMLAAIFTTTIISYPLQYSWDSLVAQMVKNLLAMQETPVQFLGRKDPLRRDRIPTLVFMSLPSGSDSKESTCNAGDLSSIPALGRSPGGGHGNPLQYSGLENPYGQRSLAGYKSMGSQSQTRLSN